MPKFLGCIADAKAQADTPEERAALDGAEAAYHEAYASASETLSPDEADRFAGQKALDELAAKDLRAKQLRALSIRSRLGLLSGIADYKRARGYTNVKDLGAGGQPPRKPTGGEDWTQGGEPPKAGPGSKGAASARALELLVENKPGLAGGPFASLDGRYRAVRGQFDAMMASLIEQFETRTGFDAPGRAALRTTVREVFGEDTGDRAAKALAEAWTATAERARRMFNAAGGGIAQLKAWGLPQYHDPIAVRAAGKPAWLAEVLPRLDRAKMIDRITGLPFSDKRLKATLSEVYDSIASGGASKREAGEALGSGMLANSRQDARFLVFKSADDWLAYADKFGHGDAFAVMLGHLDEMARDIARLQVLGPNPDHQWQWLMRFAQDEAAREEAAGVEAATRKAASYLHQAGNMMDHFTGSANIPVNPLLAKTGATTRGYLTAAMLGSVILTDAPAAPVFETFARTLAGLSRVGHAGDLIAQFASPEARKIARRSGFVNEQAHDGLIGATQDSLRLLTVGANVDLQGLNAFARRLPSAVMRLQGATLFWQARKRAFRLEFMGALADRSDKTLADLAGGDREDRAIGQLLQARGFDEADWAAMRGAPRWTPRDGASFLRPNEVIDHAGEDLGLRLAEMIELQTRQAVPETSLWTRAKLMGQDRPGTLLGEFKRSMAMFRSFTVTTGYLYAEDLMLRAMRSPSPIGYGVTAAAALMGGLTMAGAMSIQLRELAKGNGVRPMDQPEFWGAAALQGGGLGILGDFLYSAQARSGKSSAMAGWGPTGAFLSDLWNATGGEAGQIVQGLHQGEDLGAAVDKAHPGRAGVDLVRRYSPLSSMWWARAAWDRAVADQLQRVVDPEADRAFRDRAQKLKHDYGETQWWKAGQPAPDSAPDLSPALGAQP